MKQLPSILLLWIVLSLSVFGYVPRPASITPGAGNFTYSSDSRIFYETRTAERSIERSLEPLANVLAEELEIVTGIKPVVILRGGDDQPGAGDISLQFDAITGTFAVSEEDEAQGYTMSVSDSVVIRAEYSKGVSYGTTTLIQSIVEDGNGYHIPQMTIEDAPASAYRALMIDLAREPSSMGTIKEIVRLARQYKIRYLHLHFTDDQHFTFPFTEVTDDLSGNFTYSRQSLVDLAAYADARGVTIIPELDLPGHSTRLSQSDYLTRRGSHSAVAHPDNYGKIQAIIDDMLSVFTSTPYFHIGGDESSAGSALVPFIEAMNNHLRNKPADQKKRLMVWEGFHGAPTTQIPATGDDRVIVFSWESSYNPPWNLLNSGYQIINASWKPMYVCGSGSTARGPHVRQLMWPAETIHTWNKDTFMHWEPGRPVFHDEGPADSDRNDSTWDAKNIGRQDQVIGGQMLSWEQNERTIVRDLIPRLPVMADRLWNPDFDEDFAAFSTRSAEVSDRVLSIVRPVEILPFSLTPEAPYSADYRYYEGNNVQITLRNRTKIPGTIRYNTGASSDNYMDYLNFPLLPDTTPSSTAYSDPFTSPNGGFSIRAQLYRTNGEPVDGQDWQTYNNWENRIELTEYEMPKMPPGFVPDFASYAPDKVKHKFAVPLLRGPYVMDEVKGQMFRADLQTPGAGEYTFDLEVGDSGYVAIYVDLNRDGIWEASEKVLANVNGARIKGTVTLDSGSYRFRVDHASGAVAGMLWLRIEGPGIPGLREVANYLSLPADAEMPPPTPQRTAPGDSATGIRLNSSLSWTSERTDSYDLFLWPADAPKPLEPTVSGLLTNSYSLADLEDLELETEYLWTIVAHNSYGTSESSQGSFTTFNGAARQSIGWHYDGVGDDTMNASHVAGVEPFTQSNWNNHEGRGQRPGNVPFALNDQDGSATTVRVTAWEQSSNNSWTHDYENPTDNERLMGSFADQNPSITFSDLPASYVFDGYSVVVYYGNNEGPSTSVLRIQGSINDDVSRQIITGNTASAGYRAVGFVEEAGALTGPTNYTVFEDLNDPEFTVSLANNNNNGISAVQIVKNESVTLPPPAAIAIGWNYDGVGDDTLSSADVAGIEPFAQANWNNHAGNGQQPGVVPLALNDKEGNLTSLQVTAWSQSSNNSWSHDYDNPSPNEKLMNSFADRNPSITFTGLPGNYQTRGYSVIVYYGNNEGPSTSTLWIEGSGDDLVSRTIRTGNTASAGYRAVNFVEESGENSGPTNYTVFTGLNDPSFTVSLEGANNNGISAIQIITTEPDGFDGWQENTAGAGASPDSDEDGDGWVDLVEYALGGDPASGIPPEGAPRLDLSSGATSFVYSRPAGLSDVTYQLEGSINLQDWHPIQDIIPQIETQGDHERVRYGDVLQTQDVPGIGASPSRFFRLTVELK